MERELSGPIGVDVGTPPGASEIGQPVGHSNLYVKNLPPDADEPALWSLFSQCGTIEAARVVRSKAQTSKGYGFVKFQHVQQALDAIRTLHGHKWQSHQLEVKFADQDAGPPLSGSGATPSDNLYIRNLPNDCGDMELGQLFAQYGTVLECRVLHNGDMTRGAGALVRMGSIQQATAAIEGLNNMGNGTGLPLLVRFADTPEEKARKLAKKTSLPASKLTSYDLLQSLAGQYQLTMDGVHPGLPAGFAGFSATGVPDAASGRATPVNTGGLHAGGPVPHQQPLCSPFNDHTIGITTPAGQIEACGSFTTADASYPPFTNNLHSVLAASPALVGLGGGPTVSPMSNLHLGLDGSLSQHLPPQNLSGCNNLTPGAVILPGMGSQLPSSGSSTPCSLYVKNLPAETDRLFLYERFAPHGAVHSVKVLADAQTGKCKGVGFVNYGDAHGAFQAIAALHGSKIGDKFLHVSLQTHKGCPG